MSLLLALVLYVACTVSNSATMTTSQDAAIAKVVEARVARTLDCHKPNEYSFTVVDDVNVVAGGKVVAKIELPKVAKNFSLNSVEKTKVGFAVNVDWGGSLYHYEIRYDFRCKEKNFYLYKVRRVSFSTKNPDSGIFWDIKKTKVIKIKPNLPIEKFVMNDYLQ